MVGPKIREAADLPTLQHGVEELLSFRCCSGFETGLHVTGPKPTKIKVETVRTDYLIRTPKVEKLSLQAIRNNLKP